MIDLITRLIVAGGGLAVTVYAYRVALRTRYPRRVLALRWIQHAAVPITLGWSYFAITNPVVTGELVWDAYISRIVLLIVLVALWQIASIVSDEEE